MPKSIELAQIVDRSLHMPPAGKDDKERIDRRNFHIGDFIYYPDQFLFIRRGYQHSKMSRQTTYHIDTLRRYM